MPKCAVVSCTAYSGPQGRGRGGGKLSFFRFPVHRGLRTEWAKRCQIREVAEKHRICSDHFLKTDLEEACLVKLSLGLEVQRPMLKKDALPTQHLPSACVSGKSILQQLDEEEAERAERKKVRNAQRKERFERRHRQEMVEKLLSEHNKEMESLSGHDKENEAYKEDRRILDPVRLLRLQAGLRIPKTSTSGACSAATEPQDSVTQALAGADIVGVRAAPDETVMAADCPSDDDRLAADSDSDSDEDAAVRPPVAAKRKRLKSVAPTRITYLSMLPHIARPTQASRRDEILERTKEIMQLKLRVRRLEAKCLRVFGVQVVPRSDAADGSGNQAAVGKEETAEGSMTAGGSGGQANGEVQSPSVGSPHGEQLLMILRDGRSSEVPSILKQLRANQLPDDLATFMPSNLKEAKEVNHQLKVQFLNLQAVMLNWAIKNKRFRNDMQKWAEEGGKEETTVRGPRLRELLQLEAAVKAMFTESQIRHIVRDHKDSSGGVSTEKPKKPRWSDKDVRGMLELRAISSDKVVQHVREKMKIPLPGLLTAKKRCKVSPMVAEAYKDMLKKREENQKLCGMCERQVKAIDDVIDAKDQQVDEQSPFGVQADEQSQFGVQVDEISPFGRQFVQRMPQGSQDAVGAKGKKRRRTAEAAATPVVKKKNHQGTLDWPDTAATPVVKKKKKKRQVTLEWPETSDSDAELSDTGVWGQIPSSRVSWHPEIIGGDALPDRPPRIAAAHDPFGSDAPPQRPPPPRIASAHYPFDYGHT